MKTTAEPRKDARLYKVGGVWGDSIGFTKYPTHVHGWKHNKPVKGDILTCEMESGRTAVWVFADVKYAGNPYDMFFAKIEAVGYRDEIKFALPSEESGW